MYAIFIFDTIPSVGEQIPDRVAHFYCRTFGFVPTIADAAENSLHGLVESRCIPNG